MSTEDAPLRVDHDAVIEEWVQQQPVPTGPLPARAVQVLAALDANRPSVATGTQGGAA